MTYVAGGIISAPVSIYDIQQALGSTDVELADLCTDSKINKWAKYKSVGKNKLFTDDELVDPDNNKTWKSTATWWKGNDNKCGISYKSDITTVAGARTAILNETTIWSYVPPTGGSNAPFRITDFNEYYANAPSPTTSCGASDAQLKAGAILSIMVATSIDDGYSLKLNHIGSFDNYYYLAAIFDSSGNIKLLHTASKKVGQYSDGETIEIQIPYNNGNYGYQGKLSEGSTYKCFIMLSSVAYTCATSAQNGVYVPLPITGYNYGMKPCDVKCLSSSQYASVNATADGRIISWIIDLYGAGAPSSVTVQLIYATTKQVVSGQSKTINFADGAVAITGGYRRENKLTETFTCPDSNIDKYMLEFKYSSIDVRAIIKHDFDPLI